MIYRATRSPKTPKMHYVIYERIQRLQPYTRPTPRAKKAPLTKKTGVLQKSDFWAKIRSFGPIKIHFAATSRQNCKKIVRKTPLKICFFFFLTRVLQKAGTYSYLQEKETKKGSFRHTQQKTVRRQKKGLPSSKMATYRKREVF